MPWCVPWKSQGCKESLVSLGFPYPGQKATEKGPLCRTSLELWFVMVKT